MTAEMAPFITSLRLCGEHLVAAMPRCEGVNELEDVLKYAIIPSFEEGSLRPTRKYHGTSDRAQRGRSNYCQNRRLTSPAAPILEVTLQ
jgi:hypothetical protein